MRTIKVIALLSRVIFFPVERRDEEVKLKNFHLDERGSLGGAKGYESSYCYILTGSREGQYLNKEIHGTGSARTGATPLSLSQTSGTEQLMNERALVQICKMYAQ
jgi:hypothetical protein